MKKILSKVWEGIVFVAALIVALIASSITLIITAAWLLGVPAIIFLVIAKLLGWI